MRIDYLSPMTTDVVAEAEVVRSGDHLAMTRVEIHDVDGTHVATAHGTYKTGGQGEETPWTDEPEVPDDGDDRP
jgi:acyl-coenzyme A thioesterase PaaI-like protein